jgi:hypothetical protein
MQLLSLYNSSIKFNVFSLRLQHGLTLYILPNMAYHTVCTMVGLAKMRVIHLSQKIYSGIFRFHNSAGVKRVEVQAMVVKTQTTDTVI